MSLLKEALSALNEVSASQEKQRREARARNWEPDAITSCYCNASNAPCSWCTRGTCDTCGECVEDDEDAFNDDDFSLACQDCRESICGLCGDVGADKIPQPCYWPTERQPDQPYVHAECEQEECERAHEEFKGQVGIKGIGDFLRRIK